MRLALVLGAALLLGGCVSQQSQVTAPEAAADLRVSEVRIEAAQAAASSERGFNATEEVAEAILRQEALAVLSEVEVAGTRPVLVDVAIERIFVPNAASAVVGRSGALAAGTAQLRDPATGSPIGAPFAITGSGGTRLGGVIGGVVTASALAEGGERGELARAGLGLGRSLALAIYGIDPTNSDPQ